MPSTSPRLVFSLIALIGVLQIASLPLSAGDEPIAVSIADAVIGLIMLVALRPAWRGDRRARIAEITLLALSALSTAPGIVVSGPPVPVHIVAAAITIVAAICAFTLARTPQRLHTTASP